MFRRRLSELKSAVRLRDQAQALAGYVGQGDTVLNVGCGTGHLAAYLRETYGAVPTGIDVNDSPVVDIPFAEFDGTSIPFADNSFDVVILSGVLHSSHDPIKLVAECRRIASQRVIVFEDLPDGPVGKIALYARVHAFARDHRPPFDPARFDDYRKALAWLSTTATSVTRSPQSAEWLTVCPRVLFVYELTT